MVYCFNQEIYLPFYKTVDLIANDASKRRQMGLKSKEMIEAYLPANVERKLQFVYSEFKNSPMMVFVLLNFA